MPPTVICPSCNREVPWTSEAWDAGNQRCRECAGTDPVPTSAAAPAGSVFEDSVSGPSIFLTVVGLSCIAVGIYFLVLHPSNPSEYGTGSGTITLHRLVLGQTATLAGVIFCAAAWRPR